MSGWGRGLRIAGWVIVGLAVAGGLALVVAVGGLYLYLKPNLPSIASLGDVHLQAPLKIYTSDGKLIGLFGAERRAPLEYDQIPPQMVHAFLAAEDDRFFEHPGVDYQGILRAAVHLALTGRKSQGGSTITMQVARNFFLSNRKTYTRKLREIFLALEIDHRYSKERILQLYLNKIYLGKRAYGVGAAAAIYYGKKPERLSLAQTAMIAGLPKAPSALNPIANPQRARARRDYVLRRMHELNFISRTQYKNALAEPVIAQLQQQPLDVHAGYVAEMVRRQVKAMFGKAAYTRGYTAIATIDSKRQKAANRALRDNLIAYSKRHGYRGPEAHIKLDAKLAGDADASRTVSRRTRWKEMLQSRPSAAPLVPALVIAVGQKSARVFTVGHGEITLGWKALKWAKPYIDNHHTGPAPDKPGDVLAPGDVVRVLATGDKQNPWRLSQLPKVEGALVSLDPNDGSVQALVGGFGFGVSKFNRATNARRQPGSSFKPFVYSAALAKGFTTASLFNDAPVVYDDPSLKKSWRPENYEQNFSGPMPMRTALIHSVNLVSIRILRDIGINYARQYATRFGFSPQSLPRNLSMALGTASLTPMQMARAYSVFANGGFLINPYVLRSVSEPDGKTVYRADPPIACSVDDCSEPSLKPVAATALQTLPAAGGSAASAKPAVNAPAITLAPRVISQQNAYLMTGMLQDVIKHGTGRRALALHRGDLAGKTGTTNEQVDAWFSGFDRRLVTSAWVGFDKPQPLGARETGAHAALPMWIQYMGSALHNVPESSLPRPPGLVSVRIDPTTGRRASAATRDAVFETFRVDNAPAAASAGASSGGGRERGGNEQRGGDWVQKLY